MSYKYKVGQTVVKKKGYKFSGKILARYETENGKRYDVMLDNSTATKVILDTLQYKLTEDEVAAITHALKNGQGMIHIFSEEQLESMEEIKAELGL